MIIRIWIKFFNFLWNIFIPCILLIWYHTISLKMLYKWDLLWWYKILFFICETCQEWALFCLYKNDFHNLILLKKTNRNSGYMDINVKNDKESSISGWWWQPLYNLFSNNAVHENVTKWDKIYSKRVYDIV